ncbi:hypothetical protein Pcinc_012474 [Petrolisthes cinctipes]|uniref:Uncharacterized protein n=1 Tax=Petrolisthes cinctipes TaxID=88211 RepID=A0AAE1FZ96_PETCI|nr:hypothetical protein Pcinc_012474 [Petrolisthes cinctipes]
MKQARSSTVKATTRTVRLKAGPESGWGLAGLMYCTVLYSTEHTHAQAASSGPFKNCQLESDRSSVMAEALSEGDLHTLALCAVACTQIMQNKKAKRKRRIWAKDWLKMSIVTPKIEVNPDVCHRCES